MANDLSALLKNIEFSNPNGLLNVAIQADVFVRTINKKIYEPRIYNKTPEEIYNDRINDPLVFKVRAFCSDFDLEIHRKKKDFNGIHYQLNFFEQFKFASSELIHKLLKKENINVNLDTLSDLFIAFRKKGFVKHIEEHIKQANKGVNINPKSREYYKKLGDTFLNWVENDNNLIKLIKDVDKDYSVLFKKFNNSPKNPSQTLLTIIKYSLFFHFEKRINARLAQDAIDSNYQQYIPLFERKNLFHYSDSEANNILKAKICAAANYYDNYRNQNKKSIYFQYPEFHDNNFIELDDYASTLILEIIRNSCKDKHGLIANVGKTIKINYYSALRKAMLELQNTKVIFSNKESIKLTKKTDNDGIYRTGECLSLQHDFKLLDRMFLIQDIDLINYFAKELEKQTPFNYTEIILKDKYTLDLFKKRYEFFIDIFSISQFSHDHVYCSNK